jgi:hypothetical protein
MINSLLSELETLNNIEVQNIVDKYKTLISKQPFVIDLPTKKIICQGHWNTKSYGVIYVRKEADKEILFNALVEQDDYWEDAIDLIKVLPNDITGFRASRYTEYVGKRDIYDVTKLKSDMLEMGVEFIIYQEEWN